MKPIFIDQENKLEELISINLSCDVVCVTKETEDPLKFYPEGRINLLSCSDISVSTLPYKRYDTIRYCSCKYPLKISFPVGIYPQFQNMSGISYIKSYSSFEAYEGHIIKEDIRHIQDSELEIISTTPNYFMYDDIKLKVIFDLVDMKESQVMTFVKKNAPLMDLLFLRLFEKNKKIGKLYYIRDNDIYNEFIKKVN